MKIRDLADRSGVDHRTLLAWESGDNPDARVSILGRLAAFYGVGLMDLLEELPAEPTSSPQPIPHYPAQATAG